MLLMILGALIVGVTLGLMGSGGSILTVPVLTYVLGHDGKVAIPESLAIVGSIALLGMIPYARSRLVDWRSVVLFGIPGMVGTYAGAWMSRYVSAAVQLSLFAVVMLTAAVSMIRKPRVEALRPEPHGAPSGQSHWRIALQGLVVGMLTGLVGVGGGFLIVPALAVLAKLPMRMAIGTSLVLIAMNSYCGFFKYLQLLRQSDMSIDWWTIAAFVSIGAVGSITGHQIGSRINQRNLRRVFAVFVFVMGLLVLARELPRVCEQLSESERKQSPSMSPFEFAILTGPEGKTGCSLGRKTPATRQKCH
jgi:uncharacterized membrane protein YfcA